MHYLFLLILPVWLLATDIKLQVLGSGGPELDERASASYLIWVDGKAKVIVDFGGGAFLRLGQSQAQLDDIDYVLLSHFHIDHVVDFAAFVKASYFYNSHKSIKVFGPSSNRNFPDTKAFLEGQFDDKNVYAYMSEVLDTNNDYISFKPYVFSANTDDKIVHINETTLQIDLIAVTHGNVPTLAYKLTIDGKSIVFSGDTSAITDNLITLAQGADILVAHHAIPEHANSEAKSLHMPPSRIGEIALKAGVKKLLLSHRMQRTVGREKESLRLIRRSYQGEIILAEDLLIVPLTK